MESLQLAFVSVAPIFLLMALGYFLKQIQFAKKETFDAVNKMVFRIFLPVLLFYNIYTTESARIFDFSLILFTVIAVLAVFLLGWVSVLALSKENTKRGVMLQGFFRSNYAILGIPLIGYVCGDDARGLASLMAAVVVPLFNVLAVIALERFREGKPNPKKMLLGVLKNPLIIACVLGMVFFGFGIKLPSVLEKTVGELSKVATPLAIIVLGASFTFSAIKGYRKEITIVVLARLVIVPLLMLSAAALLGFRNEAIACLLVVSGSPVAVSSFAMAQQMGGDEELAAQIIVISSAFCLVTLFVWIFLLSHFGLV